MGKEEVEGKLELICSSIEDSDDFIIFLITSKYGKVTYKIPVTNMVDIITEVVDNYEAPFIISEDTTHTIKSKKKPIR